MTADSTGANRKHVHVINHTHWDREWFLTEEYTTEWIPDLIDGVEAIVADNPNYRYLFDGQSLAIEDLLRTEPSYRERIDALVASGSLGIGPQYSQPDWRMTSGELLARNLQHGLADVDRHGGRCDVAWLVDTFGHISQAPQLMKQAGLEAAYVWRGVPHLAPLLRWRSPDGSEVVAVNLFGGYRNLYGITRTPDLARRRLEAEVEKLAGHYGSIPIPLFDGYDLETEPEDPISFYRAEADVPELIELIESSPSQYVAAVEEVASTATLVEGELLSGKFGATFPGTLSARSYLKVLHGDCEHAVHSVAEPLAALAASGGGVAFPAADIERWDRELLQNAVHDCICGVSIDQVHERMERSYRRLLSEAKSLAESSLATLSAGLSNGNYVVATSPIPSSGSLRVNDEVWQYETGGVGLWPAVRSTPEPAEASGAFESGAGLVQLGGDGTYVNIGGASVGPIVIRKDSGDTYSSEPGAVVGVADVDAVRIVEQSATEFVVEIDATAEFPGGRFDALLRIRATNAHTVDVSVDIDSDGTEFVAELPFRTGVEGAVRAGMPFDTVDRPHVDTELFGPTTDPGLARILMGQREVDRVDCFPFHDHVAVVSPEETAVVHARSLRAYRAEPDGTVWIPLRRSVEWLAKSGLQQRAGDAGPAMYVPGARCERRVEHRLGLSLLGAAVPDAAVVAASECFKHRPLLIAVSESAGNADRLVGPTAELPMTALTMTEAGLVGRFHNPMSDGRLVGDERLEPGEIAVRPFSGIPVVEEGRAAVVRLLDDHAFADRAGRSRSLPAQDVIDLLQERSDELDQRVEEVRGELDGLVGDAYHRQLHQVYVAEREGLEVRLSLELNRRRLADPEAEVSLPDARDAAIAALGHDLNELRIRRRIYDYVAEALDTPAQV